MGQDQLFRYKKIKNPTTIDNVSFKKPLRLIRVNNFSKVNSFVVKDHVKHFKIMALVHVFKLSNI
jgi:hypothetical protein